MEFNLTIEELEKRTHKDYLIRKQMLKEDELKLSELETEIYMLRFINEFKPKEIAIKLNLNIKQVYDAIDRIRKKARKKY